MMFLSCCGKIYFVANTFKYIISWYGISIKCYQLKRAEDDIQGWNYRVNQIILSSTDDAWEKQPDYKYFSVAFSSLFRYVTAKITRK